MCNTNIRETILELLNSSFEKDEIKELLAYLDANRYWTAPYSTKYQYSNVGGLATYSLNTYNTLVALCEDYDMQYDKKQLILIGLFHAIAKSEYFEHCVTNKKVYNEDGKNYDELGRYDWQSNVAYAMRDIDNRYTAGSLGLTSYMILSRYMGLTEESIMAIIYCFYTDDTRDIYTLLRRYPLISLLHCASTLSLNVGVKKDV